MSNRGRGLRLAAGLWFLAALLGLGATAYKYSVTGEVSWVSPLFGIVALFMGFNAITRARKADAEEGGPGPTP